MDRWAQPYKERAGRSCCHQSPTNQWHSQWQEQVYSATCGQIMPLSICPNVKIDISLHTLALGNACWEREHLKDLKPLAALPSFAMLYHFSHVFRCVEPRFLCDAARGIISLSHRHGSPFVFTVCDTDWPWGTAEHHRAIQSMFNPCLPISRTGASLSISAEKISGECLGINTGKKKWLPCPESVPVSAFTTVSSFLPVLKVTGNMLYRMSWLDGDAKAKIWANLETFHNLLYQRLSSNMMHDYSPHALYNALAWLGWQVRATGKSGTTFYTLLHTASESRDDSCNRYPPINSDFHMFQLTLHVVGNCIL